MKRESIFMNLNMEKKSRTRLLSARPRGRHKSIFSRGGTEPEEQLTKTFRVLEWRLDSSRTILKAR